MTASSGECPRGSCRLTFAPASMRVRTVSGSRQAVHVALPPTQTPVHRRGDPNRRGHQGAVTVRARAHTVFALYLLQWTRAHGALPVRGKGSARPNVSDRFSG